MALEEQGPVVQISRLLADLFTYYKRHTRCLVFTFQSELLSYFAFYSNNKTQTLVNIQLQKNSSRYSEPLPLAKRDETLPCALFLFIGKCMEMIV